MSQPTTSEQESITLQKLYPQLSGDELRQAEENLERYLMLMLRIYERIRNDPEAYARFRALTASKGYVTIDAKRSNGPATE